MLPTTHKEQKIAIISKTYCVVTNNWENCLKEFKEHFLDRNHPQAYHRLQFVIFQPKFQTENNDSITLIRTYNPNDKFNLKKIHTFLDRIKNTELKTYFQKKKILLSRQPPNLSKLLTAKFERLAIPKQIKQVGFFTWL